MAGMRNIFYLTLILFVHTYSIKVGIILEDRISSNLSVDVHSMIDQYFNITEPETRAQFNNDTVELVWRQLKVTNGIYASQSVCDLVKNRVHGLITVLPCRSRKYIMSQVDMFNLPHLALSTEPCDSDTSSLYTLHMTPSHTLYSQLITDIISPTNWPAVGLIFDSTLHSVLRNEIIRSFTDQGIETTLIPVSDNPESLLKLQRSRSKHFIVWTHPDTMHSVFHMAKTMSMTTAEYSWMVFSDDVTLMSVNKLFRTLPSSNLLLIRRHRPSKGTCQSVTPCQEFTTFQLTLADAVLYYQATPIDPISGTYTPDTDVRCFSTDSSPLTWGADLMTKLRQVALNGLTGMQGFDHTGYPKVIEYGLYGIKYDSDEESMGSLGTWKNNQGLLLPGGKLFANRFQTFGNKQIYVTAREERPFVIREQVGNKTVFTGFAFDILKELSSRLQFRYSVIEPGDPRYGVEEQNGTWNGMIGKVIKENIAMAIGPFAITSTRETKVDFTTPFWEDSFGILTLKSQSETGKLFQMMKPFTTDVWVSIAGAMVLVSLVSFMSSYYSPYTEWRRDSTNVSKKEASLKENFWIIYSSVIEQGPSFHPSGISSRCILGFWWLFTILIVSTYTANLAAFLTVVDASSSINNLEELIAERELGILIQDGGNIMTMFQKSNNTLYRQVWRKIQQSPSVSSIEDALKHVKTGKYAYIGMKSIIDHTAAESCGIYAVSKDTFNSGTFGFVVPENAPYLDVASYNIMKMLEGGLVDNWQQRWWPKVYNCSGEQNARTGSATSLRLDSLGGLFIVYCAITAAGFISLLMEIVFRKFNPKPPPKLTQQK